jgi:hypothetical protein
LPAGWNLCAAKLICDKKHTEICFVRG